MKQLNIAPGMNRGFIASEWPCFHKDIWEKEFREAKERVKNENIMLYGFDTDKEAVKLSEENAWKAGVSGHIDFRTRDIRDFEYTKVPQKIITNPPYAQRMLTETEAEELYRIMGEKMLPLKNNSLFVITSNDKFPQLFGKRRTRTGSFITVCLNAAYIRISESVPLRPQPTKKFSFKIITSEI